VATPTREGTGGGWRARRCGRTWPSAVVEQPDIQLRPALAAASVRPLAPAALPRCPSGQQTCDGTRPLVRVPGALIPVCGV
jgi:hypothetical protein